MSRYIVRHACAKMPSSCRGTYRRVAVLEVEDDCDDSKPLMISARARGVVRVVETWEGLNVGKTHRCAFSRALAEANELARRLNAGT